MYVCIHVHVHVHTNFYRLYSYWDKVVVMTFQSHTMECTIKSWTKLSTCTYVYVYIEYLYSFQDGWVEDVHSSVDFVGDKHFWLLHKTLNLTCAFIVDDHSILGGLLNLCHLQ